MQHKKKKKNIFDLGNDQDNFERSLCCNWFTSVSESIFFPIWRHWSEKLISGIVDTVIITYKCITHLKIETRSERSPVNNTMQN